MSDRSLPQRGYWHELYELSFDQANERVRAFGTIQEHLRTHSRGEITAERALAEIAAVTAEQLAAIQQPADAIQSSGSGFPTAPDPRPAVDLPLSGGTGLFTSAGAEDIRPVSPAFQPVQPAPVADPALRGQDGGEDQ